MLGHLSGPCRRRQCDRRFPQGLRTGDALRERQAQSAVAERKVEAVGIEPGQPPRTVLGPEKLRYIEPDGGGVFIVHVRDGTLFCGEQSLRAGKIGRDLLSFEVDGASKAGIEMSGDKRHSPERKIGKARVKLGFGMTREKAPADLRIGFRRAGNWCVCSM